ncbi:MAG: sigma-70 family RNA polymerase sigma factor [Nostoc sp.]
MRYIPKSESFDRRGQGEKLYCIIAGSAVTQELLHQDLSKLLALLNPRQREVLTLRFGLSDNQQLTLSQVAKRLNLSRETIRKTEHLALKILRSHQNKIKDYLLN